MLAKVIILTTDALEQQHRHQIARSSLNQSVPHPTVDVRCVFDVDDVSTPCIGSHFARNVTSSLFVVLQVHWS